MPTHSVAERGRHRHKDENPRGKNRLMLLWLQEPYGFWSLLGEKKDFCAGKRLQLLKNTDLFGLVRLV